VVEEAPTPEDALRIAGIDWRVKKQVMCTLNPAAPVPGATGAFYTQSCPGGAIVRQDTGRVLGVVGDDYTPFQNSDLAELAYSVSKDALVESAGTLKHGKQVFMLLKAGEFAIGLGTQDTTKTYALLSTSHDGTQAIRVYPTSVRVVCNNTLSYSLKDARRGYSVRHTGDLAGKLVDLRNALQGLEEDTQDHVAKCEALANKPLSQEELKGFFLDVYQRAYAPIIANPKDRKEERARERALQTVTSWVANMDHEHQCVGMTQGTAWAALNSVTQWADHERKVRNTSAHANAGEARAYANLFGVSDALKRTAFDRALELV